MNLLKQNYIKYGLIMCIPVILCLLYMELSGQNLNFDQKSPIFMIFMMIAPFVVLWMGIRAKKKSQKNKITFKQGLTEGFKISLVFGIVSPFIFLFYYVLVNPQIVENVKVVYNMPNTSNAMIIAFDLTLQLISATIFGTIYSAIASFFLKNNKN